MRTLISIIFTVVFASSVGAKTTFSPQDLERLLQHMTLQEKVGQMLQLNIDVLGHEENGQFVLDKDKLERVFLQYKVGSILNAPGAGPYAQAPEWWQQTIRTMSMPFAAQVSRVSTVSTRTTALPTR